MYNYSMENEMRYVVPADTTCDLLDLLSGYGISFDCRFTGDMMFVKTLGHLSLKQKLFVKSLAEAYRLTEIDEYIITCLMDMAFERNPF